MNENYDSRIEELRRTPPQRQHDTDIRVVVALALVLGLLIGLVAGIFFFRQEGVPTSVESMPLDYELVSWSVSTTHDEDIEEAYDLGWSDGYFDGYDVAEQAADDVYLAAYERGYEDGIEKATVPSQPTPTAEHIDIVEVPNVPIDHFETLEQGKGAPEDVQSIVFTFSCSMLDSGETNWQYTLSDDYAEYQYALPFELTATARDFVDSALRVDRDLIGSVTLRADTITFYPADFYWWGDTRVLEFMDGVYHSYDHYPFCGK